VLVWCFEIRRHGANVHSRFCHAYERSKRCSGRTVGQLTDLCLRLVVRAVSRKAHSKNRKKLAAGSV
jgi:hypothetical protein